MFSAFRQSKVLAPLLVGFFALVGIFFLAWNFSVDTKDEKHDPYAFISSIKSDDYFSGKLDAPVRLIVYTDLECPFCRILHQEGLAMVKKEFGESVVVVYRYNPLALFPNARPAAYAAECAARVSPELFWGFSTLYFLHKNTQEKRVTQEMIKEMLLRIGVPESHINKCALDSTSLFERVERDVREAAAAEFATTPTVVVTNGVKTIVIPGYRPQSIRAAIQTISNSQ